MAKNNEKPRRLSPDEARLEIEMLAHYLNDEAASSPANSVGHAVATRLRWAAECFERWLRRDPESLDHAFGVIRPRGNPGGKTKWELLAAEKDRSGLTTPQVIEKLPPKDDGGDYDERSVRRSLVHGRASYQRKAVKTAIENAYASLTEEERRSPKAQPSNKHRPTNTKRKA
jgi:hypothetical protein